MPRITVEKRVAIFSAAALAELGRLGATIEHGSGRLFARLDIPESVEKDVLRILKHEGFSVEEADAPGQNRNQG